MKSVVVFAIFLIKFLRRLWMLSQIPLFKSCGHNVKFGHSCEFSHDFIEIGNDVYIGPRAMFMSGVSKIRIGNKVMFGPGVTIMGGDHRTNIIGQYMFDVVEKLPENDKDVVIEDDVWIGSNVLILKGVTIGRGSIVGAGSVVVKSIPPYSIYTGSPPLKVRERWSSDTIEVHETKLQNRRPLGSSLENY